MAKITSKLSYRWLLAALSAQQPPLGLPHVGRHVARREMGGARGQVLMRRTCVGGGRVAAGLQGQTKQRQKSLFVTLRGANGSWRKSGCGTALILSNTAV